MMEREHCLGLGILFSGVFAGGVTAAAFEAKDLLGFRAGPVVVRPRLVVGEEYNDNLFRGESGVSAFTTYVVPGFNINTGADAPNQLALDYRFTGFFYHPTEEIPVSVDSGWSHSLGVDATVSGSRLTSSTGGSVLWQDTVQSGSIDFGEGVVQSFEVTMERFYASGHQSFRYSLSDKTQLSLDAGVRSSMVDRSNYYDTLEWSVGPGATYRISEKLTSGLDFKYGQAYAEPRSGADPMPTLNKLSVAGSLSGRLTEKLSGQVRAGFQHSEYEETYGNTTDPIFGVSLKALINEKTSATLGYDRTVSVSPQTGRVYAYDTVRVSLQKAVGRVRPWVFGLSSRYSLISYQGSGSSSDLDLDYAMFGTDLTVAYMFRSWLGGSLGYSYERVDSSGQSRVDYDVNRVTLAASIGY